MHVPGVSCTLREILHHNPLHSLSKYARFQHFVHTSREVYYPARRSMLEVCTFPAFHAHFEKKMEAIPSSAPLQGWSGLP